MLVSCGPPVCIHTHYFCILHLTATRTSPSAKKQRSASRAAAVAPQWLKAGMQADIDELAIYVDALCAEKASKDHQQEKEAFIAQIRMVSVRAVCWSSVLC